MGQNVDICLEFPFPATIFKHIVWGTENIKEAVQAQFSRFTNKKLAFEHGDFERTSLSVNQLATGAVVP